jgi:hypothetical protein
MPLTRIVSPVSQDQISSSRCRGCKSVGRQGCANERSCDTQVFTHSPDEEGDAVDAVGEEEEASAAREMVQGAEGDDDSGDEWPGWSARASTSDIPQEEDEAPP